VDLRILVIDDDQDICELIEESFRHEGWAVAWCTQGEDGSEMAREQAFDAVLVDVHLSDVDGLQLCRRLTENLPGTPVLMMTAFGDMTAAVSALRAGACDFINKPIELGQLRGAVERAVRERYRSEAIRRLAPTLLTGNQSVGALQGRSRPMLKVYDLIRRVANTEATVLLSGESGTGKELVACALHSESQRAQAPFVAINCAAIPAHLLESELFGHVRGSFTDASENRKGLFAQAGRGTLFLDEIGEMPLELQPKLLRVLQERKLRPVGGDELTEVHARLIAATNRDLESLVAAGRFREDLYYRLNVVRIAVPPLRTRGNDVLLLAEEFVKRFAARMGKPILGISPPAARQLLQYDWPGNVRQLENTIEHAVALARGEELAMEDLPQRVRNYDPAAAAAEPQARDLITLDQQERRHIDHVLSLVKGNKTQAARLLGVDRRTLYRKLVRERKVVP
jgi:two-component system response regulator HydG